MPSPTATRGSARSYLSKTASSLSSAVASMIPRGTSSSLLLPAQPIRHRQPNSLQGIEQEETEETKKRTERFGVDLIPAVAFRTNRCYGSSSRRRGGRWCGACVGRLVLTRPERRRRCESAGLLR